MNDYNSIDSWILFDSQKRDSTLKESYLWTEWVAVIVMALRLEKVTIVSDHPD